MEHRETLADPKELQRIVQRRVDGGTNPDGSVTIWFPGGEGGPRHGYLYHSGRLLTSKPGNPQDYFCHLTNGWYEY